MDIVIVLCIMCMLYIVIATLIKFGLLKGMDKLKFLKSFKKGKFAVIYLTAVPLYWMGLVHKGTSVGVSLFLAIRASVELIVLKYDYNSVALLMEDNNLFCIAMYICFSLVAINAVIFTITLFWRGITNNIFTLRAKYISKKVYYIVGYNNQCKSIIKSIDKKVSSVILLAEKSEEIADFCFVEKVAYIRFHKNDKLNELFFKIYKKKSERNKFINVIINTGNDSENVIYTEQISDVIIKMNLFKNMFDDMTGFNCYVFGEPENMSAFLYFVEKTNGCVHYVNKYKLIAMDFVGRYPLTEFMTQKHIDYDTATIKENVSINVVMIGFGKTNQQIFLTSVANNQFLTYKEGKLVEKPVNYWIYDKNDSRKEKNLNHNYYRYANELNGKSEAYLPLPPKPAKEEFFELDINDPKFYDSIKNNIKARENADMINYIIIAFGTDMENLDFAEKIVAKLKEWDIFSQTKVFVKIRCNTLFKNVVNKEYAKTSGFYSFGNEELVVYNHNQIVSEQKEIMARDRHLCYSIKDGMSVDDEKIAKKKALNKWYEQSQIQRESNIYACLSIRLKLQLLGFDYKPDTADGECAKDEFLEHYQKGNPIVYTESKKAVNGKRAIEYTNNYIENSVRHIMAIQEHQRWNAYMLSCGVIPSTIKQIENNDYKNLELRRHGNITTFQGLIAFRKIVARVKNTSEEQEDVIRYDYQLMDDVVWILSNAHCKIVKK